VDVGIYLTSGRRKANGLFGSNPLQILRVGDTPLLFVYFEICHCNSSFTLYSPFSTSSKCWPPVSDRICVHIHRMISLSTR
jgi:hypothetical protein